MKRERGNDFQSLPLLLVVDSEQLAVISDQLAVGGFRVIAEGRKVILSREEMIGRLKLHGEQARNRALGIGLA